MACQLIQTHKLDDSNRAEREMLDFLHNLPESYFVYRELQLTPAYRDRIRGLQKKQPDFVVVSPEVGVVSIEVKDWNLDNNTYEWQNQQEIRKIAADGHVSTLRNPMVQVDAYLHALMELVSRMAFVSSIVAFPRLSRSAFLDNIKNVNTLRNPQSRFYLDLDRTLFRENLDQFRATPEDLLEQVVQKNPKFHPISEANIEAVHRMLMPSSFIVGDYTERQQARKRLQVLTEQQQRWIFDLDSRRNYLLDVAGSGKTNVLISKAIHLVNVAKDEGKPPPRILLTTYNSNLEKNIRRIFRQKIASAPEQQDYQEAITVQSIPSLMESIVMAVLEISDMVEYRLSDESLEEYEARLRDDVRSALESEPKRFRYFDYVFIDEIQDFDNFFLLVVHHVCKNGNYFFVGDIGQKIYEREHNLKRLGIVTERFELQKSYKMFRTPRFIAELATRFVLNDRGLRQEFRNYGYTEDFNYPKNLSTLAEILRAEKPEQAIAKRVCSLLDGVYTEADIMIVTSAERRRNIVQALENAKVRYVVGETDESLGVTITSFMDVKGLEKEVVLVSGIEDLFERSKPEAVFQDIDAQVAKERLSRRKIYVSLTRPLEELIIYYQDSTNRFIGELLDINREIQRNRQGPGYGI